MRRSPWFWPAIVLGVGVLDVAILTATGNGNSGKNDGTGQILGFWIFVLCVLALVVFAVRALVRRRRARIT